MISIILLTVVESTLKTLKEKTRVRGHDRLSNLLGGVMKALSLLIFGKVATSGNIFITSLLVGFTAYLGNELSILLYDKFKKDDKWQLLIVPYDMNCSNEILSLLKELRFKHTSYAAWNNNGENVINIWVQSKTKENTKIIYELCNNKASIIKK